LESIEQDLRKGYQFLFLDQIDGFFLRGPMNPLISLQTPYRDLEVDLPKILTGRDPEEVLDVSDHPFHAPLLIGSPWGTEINREGLDYVPSSQAFYFRSSERTS